jgi:hypothetical protein
VCLSGGRHVTARRGTIAFSSREAACHTHVENILDRLIQVPLRVLQQVRAAAPAQGRSAWRREQLMQTATVARARDTADYQVRPRQRARMRMVAAM